LQILGDFKAAVLNRDAQLSWSEDCIFNTLRASRDSNLETSSERILAEWTGPWTNTAADKSAANDIDTNTTIKALSVVQAAVDDILTESSGVARRALTAI